MKRRTKLGKMACVLLVAACSAPATTRNAGAPAEGPRFASGGPDAEEYGASLGYPKGELRSFLQVPSLVGGFHRAHSSGVNMIMAVHAAMPKTLVMPSTGTRIVFGA